MSTSFLLRFQEPTDSASAVDVRCGTQTGTRVETEHPDADCFSADRTVIPRASRHHKADSVETHLNRMDDSPNASIVMATTTRTLVQAESPDHDPGRRHFQIIPRCSSY